MGQVQVWRVLEHDKNRPIYFLFAGVFYLFGNKYIHIKYKCLLNF